jgi:hypothetical protein
MLHGNDFGVNGRRFSVVDYFEFSGSGSLQASVPKTRRIQFENPAGFRHGPNGYRKYPARFGMDLKRAEHTVDRGLWSNSDAGFSRRDDLSRIHVITYEVHGDLKGFHCREIQNCPFHPVLPDELDTFGKADQERAFGNDSKEGQKDNSVSEFKLDPVSHKRLD